MPEPHEQPLADGGQGVRLADDVRRPPDAILAPDEVRCLLRECVTVVKPGEAVVIRKADLTPNQQREYQMMLSRAYQDGFLPFRAFVFAGDELGVAEATDGRAAMGLPPFDIASDHATEVTTHHCPPDDGGPMPCCGLTPFEAPRTDRMTLAGELVTCTGEKRDRG